MKHIHFDVESDGFYGAYWACKDGSDCTVIAMLGDDPEDYMARSAVKWLLRLGVNILTMSPAKKDYGHHNYPLERIEKAMAWLKLHGNEKIGIAGASTTGTLALTAASIFSDISLTIAMTPFADELHADVRALCDHDTRIVLGRTAAGTLTLTEDERGLYGVIKINTADGDAMNLYARVQRGDVSQCSFGFDILDEEYIINPDGSELWLIRKVKLYEVSVVTFPAYEETSVSARSADTPARRERRLAAWKNNMKERLEKCST